MTITRSLLPHRFSKVKAGKRPYMVIRESKRDPTERSKGVTPGWTLEIQEDTQKSSVEIWISRHITRFFITARIKSEERSHLLCWGMSGNLEANHSLIFWEFQKLDLFWRNVNVIIERILEYQKILRQCILET